MVRSTVIVCAVAALLELGVSSATAEALPEPASLDASCMGSGSSFYGTFAPQQRAFVAKFVIDSAHADGSAPGSTYAVFAQAKEGGAIPTPCGTRLE